MVLFILYCISSNILIHIVQPFGYYTVGTRLFRLTVLQYYNSCFVMCRRPSVAVDKGGLSRSSQSCYYTIVIYRARTSRRCKHKYNTRYAVKTRPPNTCSSSYIIVIVCTILLLSSSDSGFTLYCAYVDETADDTARWQSN